MKYYIAATESIVVQPSGMGGRLFRKRGKPWPGGTLHAVEVGSHQTMCGHELLYATGLKPFPDHDFEAARAKSQSGRCADCAQIIEG
jgi:hypothetical protein